MNWEDLYDVDVGMSIGNGGSKFGLGAGDCEILIVPGLLDDLPPDESGDGVGAATGDEGGRKGDGGRVDPAPLPRFDGFRGDKKEELREERHAVEERVRLRHLCRHLYGGDGRVGSGEDDGRGGCWVGGSRP